MKELFLDSNKTDSNSKYSMKEYQVEINKGRDYIEIRIDGYINDEGENVVIYLDFCDGPRLFVFDSVDEKPKEFNFEMAQQCWQRTITDEDIPNISIGSVVVVPWWVLYDQSNSCVPVKSVLVNHCEDGKVIVSGNGRLCQLNPSEIFGVINE